LQEYFSQKDEIFNAHKDAVNSESASPGWIGVLVGTDIEPELQEQIVSGALKISNAIPVAALVVSRYTSDDGQVFVTVDSFSGTTHAQAFVTELAVDPFILSVVPWLP
jgi:hypothetical protein